MKKEHKMLEIKSLTKHYRGSEKGITELDLHVMPSDLYAFIGHNGAGKTTTLKAVAGIHGYDSGDIIINGIDMKTDPMGCKRVMAYIPDDPELFDYLTGMQYLNFIADIFNIPADIRRERIEKYVGLFEITGVLGDLISSYSHGMKQKLAIISAFIHEPRLLILDEPFVGLDPKAALKLKELMKELCNKGGAVFFSTHVLDVAERLCNKVAMIKDGRLVISGNMNDILKDGDSLESIFMRVAENE